MKPTTYLDDHNRRDLVDRRCSRALHGPRTDYSFKAAAAGNGGRCFGTLQLPFRAISRDYIENEARHSFAGEALFFGLIGTIAALPIWQSVNELIHLVRSFGAL